MDDYLSRKLTLSKLEILMVDVPQIESFSSAVGTRNSRKALLLRWFDEKGQWGIAECSCRPDPYFSHEYLEGVATIITEFVWPKLAPSMTYGELVQHLSCIRGWGFARATVLEAVHDLWRRNERSDPLTEWANTRPNVSRIPVGISLGLYPTTDALITKVGESIGQGYRRIKLKIKPGLPNQYLEAVREAFPDVHLGVDANGAFSESDIDTLASMESLNLANLEQPFPPDRLDLCARLKNTAKNLVICLDESVTEIGHLYTAIKLGAIDELNIKPGRVGGMPTAITLANICEKHHIKAWVGGMFETSIGRSENLRFAACFPTATAHDLSPSVRYFKKDLVQSPIAMYGDGFIDKPERPVKIDESAIAQFLDKSIEKQFT